MRKTFESFLGSRFLAELLKENFSIADEKKWADEIKGPIFFSHGKTNSCAVVIEYIGSNKVDVLDTKNR